MKKTVTRHPSVATSPAAPAKVTQNLAPVAVDQYTQWLFNVYYPTLDTAIGTAYNYMHTTVNWTISLLTAVVLFLATRNTFPDEITWYALCACLVLVTHFGMRTAKGYINIMRWAAIQRSLLLEKAGEAKGRDRANSAGKALQQYHIEWGSPLPCMVVLYKVVIELGFLYLLAAIIALLIYTAQHIAPSPRVITAICMAVTFTLGELLLLRFSPYFRKTYFDVSSRELR